MLQCTAAAKSTLPDSFQVVQGTDALQCSTALKRILTDAGNLVKFINVFQGAAI